jgi:hypothetical protein
MQKTLLVAGLVMSICSLGQAQSSKGQSQTPTQQGQEKTTGADHNAGQNSANPSQGKNGQGQSATNGSEQANASSITGCLQRESGSGRYTITGSDGKKHELMTSDRSIRMEDHVGHRVTVQTASETGGDRANTNASRGAGPTGELNVTSLTMVSSTCQ